MVPPKAVSKLFSAGYQLTKEAYVYLDSHSDIESVINQILSAKPENPILSLEAIETILNTVKKQSSESSSQQLKKSVAEEEKKQEQNESSAKEVQTKTRPKTHIRQNKIAADIEVLYTPEISPKKVTVKNFEQYFTNRYKQLAQLFRGRHDIATIVSTNSLLSHKYKEDVSLVALVYSKSVTRNGNVFLELEDLEGQVKGIISTSQMNAIKKAPYILEDAVLCFTGNWNNDILHIRDIQWPDIPYTRQPNYAYDDVLALFISDIHIGSKHFMGDLFMKVVNFLNGQLNSERYNQLGEKIKYLFVGGDVVDGVGVYPEQENDLALKNIRLQYLLASEYFEKIASDIEIIIIPGNHDGARSAEPQTPIQQEFASELYKLDNVKLLGSPTYIKAHGVEVLMSHGSLCQYQSHHTYQAVE